VVRVSRLFFISTSDIDTSYSLVDGSISNGISDLKLARHSKAAANLDYKKNLKKDEPKTAFG